MTDTARVVQWFIHHPGSTRFEAQLALHGIHVTARMSDARAQGVVFSKVRDGKAWRFTVERVVTTGVPLTLDMAS